MKTGYDRSNWRKRVKEILVQDANPGRIAAGLAVGVFIGCIPLYGLQTLTALATAFFFRLNKPSCVAGLWINNPVTMIPMAGISYKLGCLTLGLHGACPSLKTMDWHFIRNCAEPFLLGSVVLGLLTAVPAYLICYPIVKLFEEKRRLI